MPLLKVNQIASYSGNTLTVGTTGDTVTLATGASSSGFGATYNSWILNEQTCLWEAPVAKPNDSNIYNWNETNLNWELVE